MNHSNKISQTINIGSYDHSSIISLSFKKASMFDVVDEQINRWLYFERFIFVQLMIQPF